MNFKKFSLELNPDLIWRLMLLFCSIALILNISETAQAATAASYASDDVIGNTLCRLVNNLTGGIARGIATVAIFAVGVGMFLGKLNWGIFLATAVAVGVIFYAQTLVGFLAGASEYGVCPTA